MESINKDTARYQLDRFLNHKNAHTYGLDAHDIAILNTIAYFIDCDKLGKNACFAKQEVIANRAMSDRKTINRRLSKLEKLGLLILDRHWKILWITFGERLIKYLSGTRSSTCEVHDQVPDGYTTIEDKELEDNIKIKSYCSSGETMNDSDNLTEDIVLDKKKADKEPLHFDEFWTVYPRKQGNKKQAKRIWVKNKLDEKAAEIIRIVKERTQHDRQWADRQFVPLPTTYLNGERWNDEPLPANNIGRKNNVDIMDKLRDDYIRNHPGIIITPANGSSY